MKEIMNKSILIICSLVISLTSSLFVNISKVASAPVAGFQAGRIIDDVIFNNVGSMTVNQIQLFLNSKVTNCDSNHTGFTGGTGTVYNAPWVCLKDFYENTESMYTIHFNYLDKNGVIQNSSRSYYYNNAYKYNSLVAVYPCGAYYCTDGDYTKGYQLKANITSVGGEKPVGSISAAQIIYDAANTYSINPQVLLVLLQKEQGLITDTWPAPWQYQSATGYGCPDYQPCSSGYSGFTKQVYSAAYQFNSYKNNGSNYTYNPNRSYDIQWNPNSNCGSSSVYIQNQATASLYNYTPYQPNAAALAAGYGSGDSCSAYGNRNFYLYFTDWFGSTYGVLPELGTRYNEISNFIGKLVSVGFCNNSRTICWQEFSNGYIIYSPQTGAWESKGAIREYWISIGAQSSVAGLPKGPEKYNSTTKSWSQEYQNGVIIGNGTSGFWFITNNIKERWTTLGAEKSLLGLPISQGVIAGNVEWQEFQNGFIIGNKTTGFWESKGAIREYWASIGYQGSPAGWPIGSEKYNSTTKSWSQEYQHGTIVGNGNTGFWLITNNIKERWTTLGAEKSLLGLPLSQSIKAGNSGWQEFENGFIIGNATTGFWESKGAIREYWASIGYQSSPAGWPVGSEKYDATNQTWSQEYQNGTIYYSELQKGSFVKKIETPQTTETTIIEKV